MLLWEKPVEQVALDTPKGIRLLLDVESVRRSEKTVSCCIRKYSGDDPDVTDGMAIYAAASFSPDVCRMDGLSPDGGGRPLRSGQITVTAGRGIGVVRRRGLPVAPDEPAINPVPRAMLFRELKKQCEKAGCTASVYIHLWIPDGERLALRTFNPRLGIEGGLSILGTSGIVEPMSEQALIDTIRTEMRMLFENGYAYMYIVPGNYGADFLEEAIGFRGEASVKCSNYIGETLDMAVSMGVKGLLLVGHAGKFFKLAAGIMNTHSRVADCRMEPLAVQAALLGADRVLIGRIMDAPTTTRAVDILDEAGLLEPVMAGIMERIRFYVHNRCRGQIEAGVIVFLPGRGILGSTKEADRLAERIRMQED